jgi:hypothetical protein
MGMTMQLRAALFGRPTLWRTDAGLAAFRHACLCARSASREETTMDMTSTCLEVKQEVPVTVETCQS